MISRNYFPLFLFFFYTNYLTVQRCHSFSFSIRLMDHMNLGRSFLCPQVWKERKASPFGHGCDNSPSSKLTMQLIADLTLLWRHFTMEIWLSFNHRKYHWQFSPLSMHRLIRSLNIPTGNPQAFGRPCPGKPCLAGVGNLTQKCPVHVLYLLIWRCLKVKSSLLQTNGSAENVSMFEF